MRKILQTALLFLSLIVYAPAFAQNTGGSITIKGSVVDDQNATLPGATVKVKGTTIGVNTNPDGNYTITVPASATTLVFSFVGMQTTEVPINGKTVVNVQLKSTSTTLTDVVVIGYGTQKRGDVNGAISSVTAKDIQDIAQPSIDQMLQGKVAGVNITENSGQPGSNTSVHIRGITSFTNSEPLYVIDGVEIQGAEPSGALNSPGAGQQETTVSPLAMLNPDDIATVDVLKDASATAIYGSRGANGVIIITTKKGKQGKPKVDYDGWVGFQEQGKLLKVDDLQQYAVLQNQLTTIFGEQPREEFADPSLLGPGTNWQKAIFRSAAEQSHDVSVSGANDKSDYRISAAYFKQDGTVLGYNFDRYSLRSVVNSQATNWLKVGSVLGVSRSDENIGVGNNTGIIYNALLATPDQAVYNADGTYAGPEIASDGTREGGLNPVQQALNITNYFIRNEVNGNFYADINFTKDLSLHSEIDGDFNFNNGQTFLPTYDYGSTGTPSIYDITNATAQLNASNSNSIYWSWKEYLNYNHTWGKSSLTGLLGREVWESQYTQYGLNGSEFVGGNDVQSINLAGQLGSHIPIYASTAVMESYLARAIYTFNNKYSVTANIRSDRSSEFDFGHQTGYFPGVSASWRLSDEPFMAAVKPIADNLKIRIGYGSTGNSNINQYSYGSALVPVPTGFGTSYIIGNYGNENLRWETALQTNIGIDFSLVHDRIDGSFDYYDKTSKNFLFQKPLPYFLVGGPNEYGDNPEGIAPQYVNAGKISNKGFEFSINSRNIVGKDFSWSSTVTFTHYTNKVVSLDGAQPIVGTENLSFISLSATRTIQGQPLGEFYGYKVQGIVKTQAQLQYLATHPQSVAGFTQVVSSDPLNANAIWLGDIQYEDTNHDGKVDPSDQVPLGSPQPDFTYGITNTFTYKNFDLTLFVYGSYGGKILDALEYQTEGLSGLYQNQLAVTSNYWTPQNPNSNIPRPRGGLGNPNLVMSDRFLESASFARLQTVRFGYKLPAEWARHIAMNTLGVFVSGQNLFVISKYPGLDPEIGSFNQSPILQNIDLGRYPNPRVLTVGVNAQF